MNVSDSRLILLPTFANLNGKNDRAVRSRCCDARVQLRLRTSDTTAGTQLVYGCNACSKLYVVRENDEPGADRG
jgi:hypothetical protein